MPQQRLVAVPKRRAALRVVLSSTANTATRPGHASRSRCRSAKPERVQQRCFAELEEAVSASRSYRGKVLSLESDNDYRGRSKGITVHGCRRSRRDEVILPEATLKLLDRNVLNFVKSRDGLRASVNRPARASCSTGRPAPARPTPSAIWPATCPATPR